MALTSRSVTAPRIYEEGSPYSIYFEFTEGFCLGKNEDLFLSVFPLVGGGVSHVSPLAESKDMRENF